MGQNVTDVGYEKTETNSRELKKHAAAIHCSNTLSLLQRKVTNALLFHAYKELMLKEEHEITVKQLCRLIGYSGNNHAAIKDALKGLISTVIEWNLIDDKTGNENWTASSILASVSLEGPLCYFAYSPRMKQLLHSPSMFGKIDLVIQSRFRSSYGLALYENCIRYRGLPHTKWFDMELFKKLMGVPAGKYDIFRDFKKRVLDKAIDEVNMYSDLIITSEFQKERRSVTKVRFTLKDRAKKTRLGQPSVQIKVGEATPTELQTILVEAFAFSLEQIEQLLTEYRPEFIHEKITFIRESKAFKERKIDNLAGYLLSALKNDYQTKKTKTSTIVRLQTRQEEEVQDWVRQIEQLRQQYMLQRENAIQDAINAMTADAKHNFMTAFFKANEKAINTVLKLQRNKYTPVTILDSPQVKALLRQFAVREFDELALGNLEEFAMQQTELFREAWQKLKSLDPDHQVFQIA